MFVSLAQLELKKTKLNLISFTAVKSSISNKVLDKIWYTEANRDCGTIARGVSFT